MAAPFSGENGNPFGLRPFPLTGEFPVAYATGEAFNRVWAKPAINFKFSIK